MAGPEDAATVHEDYQRDLVVRSEDAAGICGRVVLRELVHHGGVARWRTTIGRAAGGTGRVAKAAAAAYGLSPEVELHGHEIFHAKGAWSDVPPRARVGVFDDVIEAVAAQDVRVIARGLDVVGQQARYSQPDPPHTVVLQHLLERVDEYVTSVGEYALVIAEEVDAQAKHRADLSTYREVGTLGYRHRELTRIVDTLHFAPSNASRLVQAADVIAFLYRRVFTCEETDERSRKAKLAMWNRLVPRVQHELCWFPSTGSGGQMRLWGRDVR